MIPYDSIFLLDKGSLIFQLHPEPFLLFSMLSKSFFPSLLLPLLIFSLPLDSLLSPVDKISC